MTGGFIEPIGDVVCRDESSLYENVMISFEFSKPEIDYMRNDILEARRTLKRLRKECKGCGCIMGADHFSDLCECCQDDREED